MATLDLLSGPITLDDAKERSSNVIQQLTYPRLCDAFFTRLENQHNLIRNLIAHHLGISSTRCHVSPREYWLHGSFNVCIPARIDRNKSNIPEFVLIRFPLPYRVGEATHPGNADEKLRCEAATYAWLRENCPAVPIPRLYGLGLSTGQQQYLPWWSRWLHSLRGYIRNLFGHHPLTHYAPHELQDFASLGTGYLVIETITQGNILSTVWDKHREDEQLRRNLNKGIARVLHELTATPLPKIGAFRLRDDGSLRLENRPMNVKFTLQENEGIPLDIQRRTTFSCVNDLVLEHLTAFDNRLKHQRNAIVSPEDGVFQMAGLVVARAIFPRMFRRDLRNGPFVLSLTDLHKSNIIVDDDWNVVNIIDLEFACSLPLEFQQPPFWLVGSTIEDVDKNAITTHYDYFVRALEECETRFPRSRMSEQLSSIMRKSWTTGALWVTLAIQNPISFSSVLFDRIIPYHYNYTLDDVETHEYKFLAALWCSNDPTFLEGRIQDYECYMEELDTIFAEEKCPGPH